MNDKLFSLFRKEYRKKGFSKKKAEDLAKEKLQKSQQEKPVSVSPKEQDLIKGTWG